MSTQVFTGTLTEADHKSHVPVAFEVPEGTTRLSVRFTASPARATDAFFDNLISLSLWGPDGARGARHNNPVWDFSIEATRATPGYLAGAIEPGRWVLFLDTFRILGPDPVTWQAQITCEMTALAAALPLAAGRCAPRGPGWYRGDLHAHSWHSDASWDIPDLVDWARRKHLDFVTLTDHNTTSGHAEMLSLADDGLLTMGGLELTTHHGHALSLGTRALCEWRTGAVTGKTMPELAQAVMDSGAVFVMAHPRSLGDPACTGCRWEYSDMMPGNARVIEIWNGGPWAAYNEDGLALFKSWLAEGHRLVASAGSDIHGPTDIGELTGFNHVLADSLTEAAVMAAVAAGRNYLSSGPRLILTAEARGETVQMGGTVAAPNLVKVDWTTGKDKLTLSFHGPDGVLQKQDLKPASSGFSVLEKVPTGFIMAELRDATGQLHAATNPIFVTSH